MIYTTRVRVYDTRRDDVGFFTYKRARARGEGTTLAATISVRARIGRGVVTRRVIYRRVSDIPCRRVHVRSSPRHRFPEQEAPFGAK